MYDQRSSGVADDDATIDQTILSLLLDEDCQRPWAVEEIVREVGDGPATTEGLARLHGAGLVHRLDGFVFATRPAVVGATLGDSQPDRP